MTVNLFDASLILIVSVVIAWATTRESIPILRRASVIDEPNSRSSHHTPRPRAGGIGIIAGIIAGAVAGHLMGAAWLSPAFLIGALIVAVTGFIDDYSGGLPAWLRLVLQLIAASLVVFSAGPLRQLPLPEPLNVKLGVLGFPLTLLWIVGVTNIYNFLDGIDGFAGLEGALGGLGLALVGQGGELSVMGLALAGACAGFLFHNWHPAKIFMGDVGSGTIGFLFASLPFELASPARQRMVFFVSMCLWFFLADGTLTIFRRLFRGEKLWTAHRSHTYQRLIGTGLRHDQVSLGVSGAGAVISACAVLSHLFGSAFASWAVLGLAGAGLLAYCVFTSYREKSSGSRGGGMNIMGQRAISE